MFDVRWAVSAMSESNVVAEWLWLPSWPRASLQRAYLATFLRGEDGVCDLQEVI